MKKVPLKLKRTVDDSYDIVFSQKFLKSLIVDLKKKKWGNKYAIITDSKVKKLYGDELQKKLKKSGVDITLISFPQGEKNKNLKTVDKILQKLNEEGFHRDDCIIALGGGVVGDVAGYAASIHLRGIPYLQIPTTLLSMVDSSVGGKTGVDTQWGKNLVGTFYHPKKVYISTDFLKTLPRKQLNNGIAEIIKYGVIAYPKLLKTLLKKKENILKLAPRILQEIILKCVHIKSIIVMHDEKEQGLRKALNYGHTIGHAIEKVSKFKIQHGEGVALGMLLINEIASNKKILSIKNRDKIKKLIKTYDLPTKIPKGIDHKKIMNAMSFDKKVEEGKITYIIPKKPGKVFPSKAITKRDILKACKKYS